MTDINNIPGLTSSSNESNVVLESTSEPGVLDAALENIFGTEGEDDKQKGSEKSAELDKIFPDAIGQEQDWKKLAVQFQSNYDKTAAELKKEREAVEQQYKPIAEFFHQIYEDDEVRRAFISELEPELIKPKDPHSFIKERLSKEFGEDFDPDLSDDKLKARMYNVRMEQLFKEALDGNKASTPKSLKELREQRKRQAEDKQKDALAEKQRIIGELKWDENTYNDWLTWAQKIKPLDLAKLKDRIDKQSRKSQGAFAPFIGNIPGGKPVALNQFKQELDAFFGPD